MIDGSGEFGIEPIGPNGRVLSLWDNVVLWGDLGISLLVMVVGMFLVPGLGLAQALTAILIGAVIGNTLLGIGAAIGASAGVPTMVLLRAPLGKLGSYLPTGLNIVQLIGWTALEVIIMAQATDLLTTRFFGLPSLYPVWVVGFTGLTLLMTLSGPIAVVKRWLARYAIWAVLICLIWITFEIIRSYDVGALLSRPGTGALPFWIGVDLVVALPISWFPLVADYSRFARSPRDAFWGTAIGYFIPHVWLYGIGALLVLSAGVVFDPLAPANPLLAAIAGLTAGWLALVVLLVGETDEGFANLYSTAVSVKNLAPGVSLRTIAISGAALVVLIGWTIPLTQYESFLLLIGSLFVPLLGVLAADFISRDRRYDGQALVDTTGDFQPGIRLGGTVVWLLGVATYLGLAGVPALGIAGAGPAIGGTIPSFVVAFVLYLAVARITSPSLSSRTRQSSTPR